MSKYLPAALGIAVMLMASTALARERSVLDSAGVKASSASLDVSSGPREDARKRGSVGN
jgi:hypothetical protein